MDIYVGNLPYTTTNDDLQSLFSEYGEVARATVISDRETQRSKGFGFVSMPNDEQARGAIEALDRHELDGRPLRVNEATPRPDRGGPPRR